MRFHENVGVGSSFASTTATPCIRQHFGHNQTAYNHLDETTKNFQTKVITGELGTLVEILSFAVP